MQTLCTSVQLRDLVARSNKLRCYCKYRQHRDLHRDSGDQYAGDDWSWRCVDSDRQLKVFSINCDYWQCSSRTGQNHCCRDRSSYRGNLAQDTVTTNGQWLGMPFRTPHEYIGFSRGRPSAPAYMCVEALAVAAVVYWHFGDDGGALRGQRQCGCGIGSKCRDQNGEHCILCWTDIFRISACVNGVSSIFVMEVNAH